MTVKHANGHCAALGTDLIDGPVTHAPAIHCTCAFQADGSGRPIAGLPSHRAGFEHGVVIVRVHRQDDGGGLAGRGHI